VLQEAERQYYDPARIRQELDEVDEARRTGVIDDEEADQLEEELIARLMRVQPRQ
jgi:chorismate mutase